ncbi:hypothetical protein TWF718_002197 [Orbilia javanica]|uniref:Uncharacterized protein n=1 Tax=Orbilia javanica TaxID=47235 RepID=A0AAN8MQ73_9PEZI
MAPTPQTKAPTDEGANLVFSESNETETKVALVALVFAAIAFIAAFLQALLQYLTSNQRDKCLVGAIGAWSVHTKTRWDIWKWRIVVQYPKLRLDPRVIVGSGAKSSGNIARWARNNLEESGYGICTASGHESVHGKLGRLFWLLEDRGSIIRQGSAPLTFWGLTTVQKLSWLWFCITKRSSGSMPFARAGWCNLLTALAVMPHENLVSHYENADVIPSSVDVPVQKVEFFYLCIICYLVNIKDVRVNLIEGTINAQNKYIKLNTQEIPGLGKFVTVDGDFEGLKETLAIADPGQLVDVCNVAKGGLLGYKFDPTIEYFDESTFLFGLAREWGQQDWRGHIKAWKQYLDSFAPTNSERAKLMDKVSLVSQASRYSKHKEQDPTAEWSDTWLTLINSCNPTVIKYLAIMPVSGIWTATPQKLFFDSYRPHLDEQRKRWFAKSLDPKNGDEKYMPRVKENGLIEAALISGAILFLRETADFCITGNRLRVLPENYTWAWLPNRPVIQQWRSDISHQTLNIDNHNLYLPEVVIRLINGSIPSVREADDYIKLSSGTRNQIYTIESAVLLSLFLVDCRLQAIWSLLEEAGGRFSTLQSGIGDFEFPGDQSQIDMIEKACGIDALTCDFMALWFELGNRVDLVGDSTSLLERLSQVLDQWENDDSPCIPRIQEPTKVSTEGSQGGPEASPAKDEGIARRATATEKPLAQLASEVNEKAKPAPQSIATELGTPSSDAEGEPLPIAKTIDVADTLRSRFGPYKDVEKLKSRKDLVLWARGNDKNGNKRLDLISKMLPLFQLRIFLMDFSYRCHSDSSDAYLAEGETTIALRLI